ncbi:hypothetical protein AB0B28_06525 [Glycomyces sp. NPDC046736]|uniref:hypothetical protein n=1 Tax=Glycomyces sp. NPDC046736 TaxID=3155615 RepID=UPI0033F3AC57
MSRHRIGEFELEVGGGVHRYRVYAVAEAGAVVVSRVHPDPDRGRDLASASGLDGDRPRFALPSNWDTLLTEDAQAQIDAAYFDWQVDVAVAGLLNESRVWEGPADAQ